RRAARRRSLGPRARRRRDGQAPTLTTPPVHTLVARDRADASGRYAGRSAGRATARAAGGCGLHEGGSEPPAPRRRGPGARADVVDGRRHGTATPCRPRPSRHVVSPPAVCAGYESGDRPLARTLRDVAPNVARTPRAAARRTSARSLVARAGELLPVSVGPRGTRRTSPRRHIHRGRRPTE